MSERRDRVLDAALTVLAELGPKGLTHRAVDAAAGLPTGSTSNSFRTRRALIEGIAERLEQLDRQLYDQQGADQQGTDQQGSAAAPSGPDDLAARIASLVAIMVEGPMAPLTRARLMFALDDNIDLGPQHRALVATLEQMLTQSGVADAQPVARRVVDYLDGLMLHTLTMADRAYHHGEVTVAVRALLIED